jgi:excisionase family DNA binding protein
MVITARDILTAEELAQLLRVNRTTIYRLLKNSGLPAFKVGKDWRFQREAVESWIKAGGDVLNPTEQLPAKAGLRAEPFVTAPLQPEGRHRLNSSRLKR